MKVSPQAKCASLVGLLAVLLFVLAPVSWMVSGAFKTSRELVSGVPSLWIEKPTLVNFRNLASSDFAVYFKNSLIVAIITSIITTLVASAMGYVLARSKGRIASIFGDISLFAYSLAPIMLVIPYVVIVRYLGLASSLSGLILTHFAFCMPFAVWTTRAFFASLPVSLEQQASVDGLTLLETIRKVILPLSAPGVFSTSLFVFALSWNEYVFARVLIGIDQKKTLPVGIEDMFANSYVDWSLIMAAGVIMLVPSLLLVFLMQRYVKQTWFQGWQ